MGELVAIFVAVYNLVLKLLQVTRVRFESVEIKPCNIVHVPIMVMWPGDDSPEEKGPWHLHVSFTAWNGNGQPIAIQNVAVRVKGRDYVPGDYSNFRPITLEVGGKKEDVWFYVYPDDADFVPNWKEPVKGKLRYQPSKGRWRKKKVEVAPPASTN